MPQPFERNFRDNRSGHPEICDPPRRSPTQRVRSG